MSFPRMLYRPSPDGHLVLDGKRFETLAVECEAELVNALTDDWLEVEDALACHPLDHDCDGEKGGSLPKAKRGRPRKAD